MIARRFFILLSGIAVSYAVTTQGSVVHAQDSVLQQSIEPFLCVYTTVQTGSQETQTDTCADQPVPVVSRITGQSGRPIITGKLTASKTVTLRIWLASAWYTYRVSPYLTIVGDEWMLDLSHLAQPLEPGMHTLTVEIETTDGLLLRNTYSDGLEVRPTTHDAPLAPTVPIKPPATDWFMGSSGQKDTTHIDNIEDTRSLVPKYPSPFTWTDINQHALGGSLPNPATNGGVNGRIMLFVSVVGFMFVVGWLFKRRKL